MEVEMKYEIRNIDNGDKQAIYLIKKESIKPYVEKIWGWDEEYQTIDFEEGFILDNFKKIMIDELFIGFIETQECDNQINIAEIHILPEYQGFGIGSDLIRNTVAEAKEKNKSTTLGCFKDNVNAFKLYKRLGFEMVNETETHFVLKIVSN